MADLVVLDFDGTETADAVLTKLRALRKQELIDLLDAVIVVRAEDGDVQIKQSVNLTALGGLAGAAMGALSGRLSDFGINDEFIRDLGRTIAPGTSALFVLVAKVTADKVIA